MSLDIIVKIAYLVASVMFIIGIKMLGKVATARDGNKISAVAMGIAIVAALLNSGLNYYIIFAVLIVASIVGVIMAQRAQMTQMPEMVALLNGFGGGGSLMVALSEYYKYVTDESVAGLDTITVLTIVLSILIGAVTLTGSLVAWGKLNGKVSGKAITFSGQHGLNAGIFVAIVILAGMAMNTPEAVTYIMAIVLLSLLIGILVVIPIGGADMPVVISLLNSYSGIAACATGFVINNQILIIAGALVGSSGIILTQIMCKAMNRSLMNVLLGGFGQTSGGGDSIVAGGGSEIVAKEIGVEETAMLFDSSSSVIIVPGYGMAVAQAQHIVRELMELLEKRNINVRFAIHPVAGRMPGHMNVLLAEANVPYDKLVEMDNINDDFANTDVALIIGANDVVNPAANTNPASPIYGMPVLNVQNARTVIVCKRSLKPGYAGIENELFGYDNCLMLFGDAKQSITQVVSELKDM
ncbi:MAG: NAD(P)(+) transhydrogenase (Re/Si-specific) subunit beta [Chitinophagales bacterium]|nr:NAD(P)(+) transhydrogenase (Re/Si-specific) subunit beta [Chitinophagales bacterium]